MSTQTLNSIASKELFTQYDWFVKTFPPVIQKCCDDFFLPGFSLIMIGISKNINTLMDKDFYFVTKIRIDKNYDVFFRSSEKAISAILERVLGKSGRAFNLNKITDLEAKIITSFNDDMFNMISEFISSPPICELRRTNFDMIHLTFLIKDTETNNLGKFIVSLPAALLKPDIVTSKNDKFDNTSFKKSTLDVKIKIGTTRFTMHEIKNLDIEDLVVFDNSNTKKLTLSIDDYEKEIKLNPNPGLIIPVENNGGENMGADNIWDSIEVEMSAEFDAVKITLGELKNIEDGLVVDLTSIYNNKVTLKVEDKIIARGELVIVNDRYGVKISEVIAQQKAISNNDYKEEDGDNNDNENAEEDNDPAETEEQAESTDGQDEEFDYSDFELDDEDI